MGFRDENLAARARVNQLEEELASTREELAEARGETPRPAREGWSALGGPVLLGVAVLLLVGAYVASRAIPAVGGLLALLGATLFSVSIMLIIVSRLLIVVSPNELAVVSGRRHRGSDGTVVGYRLVRGGRFFRLPIIERVDFLDLTNHAIELDLDGLLCEGGTRVTIDASANVKVAALEPLANNAVERFLGVERAQISNAARECLEGAVRGVVAKLTPEALRSDSLRVSEAVIVEVDHDMSRLGLVLDTFAIRSVKEL